MLALDNAGYSVRRQRILDGVSLQLRPGRLLALIGPNGAGKSTALALLAGRLRPSTGTATLDGRPLCDWAPEALARRRAMLSQHVQLAFGFTAQEVVMLGRSARRHPFGKEDEAIAHSALDATCAAHLAARNYLELSGGEQQRVQLARVLAQIWDCRNAPAYLLLDEPEAGLDIAHQHFILRFARDLARQGHGVAAVLHDLNLAARHADDIALMAVGRVLDAGPADTALEPQRLSRVYGIALHRGWLDGAGASVIVPQAG